MAGELILITGITGHVGFRVLVEALQAGYAVRGAVRSAAKIAAIRDAASVRALVDGDGDGAGAGRLEFVVVPDMLRPGAFDAALAGVVYVLHVASPLPAQTDDYERDIIQPAVRATVGILESASKVPTVKRVVITSSGALVFPGTEAGPQVKPYTEADIAATPQPPYADPFQAYSASKFLSYHATDDWYAAHRPHFDIIRLLPTFVLGANELVSSKQALFSGSNTSVLAPLSGTTATQPRPGTTVHLHDVACAHVRALDPAVPGNQDFILASDTPDGVAFDDALEIASKHFPDAVAKGLIPLGGSNPSIRIQLDVSKAEKVLGLNFLPFEDQVKNVVSQWVELSAAAAATAAAASAAAAPPTAVPA